MNYEMKMPDLATTGAAIKIVRWLAEPGQPVKRGQFILEIETDKATMEVECAVDGVFREARVAPGAEAATGDVIALLEVAGQAASPVAAAPIPSPAPVPAAQPPPPKPGGMFARNRAAGKAPAPSPAASGPSLSPARRTAARRLQESKQTIPHFYLQSSLNASSLVARREAAGPDKPVWDAFFVHGVARALANFDRMAFRYEQDRLVPQGTSAIGVAVDIDGELFVVPVDDPAAKSVPEISGEIRAAVAGLRSRDPARRLVRPGVMTISNLGGAGVESFAAIINPPESAILAVGQMRPVVVPRGNAFAAEPRISLTLSVDHRVVNGKYAADFLAAIVQELESHLP